MKNLKLIPLITHILLSSGYARAAKVKLADWPRFYDVAIYEQNEGSKKNILRREVIDITPYGVDVLESKMKTLNDEPDSEIENNNPRQFGSPRMTNEVLESCGGIIPVWNDTLDSFQSTFKLPTGEVIPTCIATQIFDGGYRQISYANVPFGMVESKTFRTLDDIKNNKIKSSTRLVSLKQGPKENLKRILFKKGDLVMPLNDECFTGHGPALAECLYKELPVLTVTIPMAGLNKYDDRLAAGLLGSQALMAPAMTLEIVRLEKPKTVPAYHRKWNGGDYTDKLVNLKVGDIAGFGEDNSHTSSNSGLNSTDVDIEYSQYKVEDIRCIYKITQDINTFNSIKLFELPECIPMIKLAGVWCFNNIFTDLTIK